MRFINTKRQTTLKPNETWREIENSVEKDSMGDEFPAGLLGAETQWRDFPISGLRFPELIKAQGSRKGSVNEQEARLLNPNWAERFARSAKSGRSGTPFCADIFRPGTSV
jgi:hypothetical protein